MSEDIHKWTDGRYTLMFDEHTFFVWDNERDERMCALEVTEKLNEQQATIDEIEKNFDDLVEWASKIANRNVILDEQIGQLQRENEQLRLELKEKEEDERLYANEIVELRKTNEEWLQFKELGGDY